MQNHDHHDHHDHVRPPGIIALFAIVGIVAVVAAGLLVPGTPMVYPAPVAHAAQACSDPTEPNNAPAEAQPLALDEVQSHAFCTSGDEDWFSFTAEAGSWYRIETVNLGTYTDTILELYASDGTTLIAADDDGSDAALASRIVVQLEQPGTHYLKVTELHSNMGPGYTYDLQLTTESCTDTYEPDNTPAEATPIALATLQSHALCTTGDEDWLAFTAEPGGFYAIETSNLSPNTDTVLELYQPDGVTLIASNDDSGGTLASRIIAQLPAAGPYYIRVQQLGDSGSPTYTYDIQVQRSHCNDLYEPDNSAAEARPIEPGIPQTHALCTTGDEDWVAFTPVPGTTYRIETTNLMTGTDTVLELYQPDGVTMITANDDLGSGLASALVWSFPTTATYYLKASHFSGRGDPEYTYDLLITPVECADSYEPNDSPAAATFFALGTTQRHTFCTTGDADWVTFTGTAGERMVIETRNLAPGTDTVLELYGSDGTSLISFNDDYSAEVPLASRLEVHIRATDTYYVRVVQYNGTGGPGFAYDLAISRQQPPPPLLRP